MNRPPLRLTHPGQLPAPTTGDDSLSVLSQAIDSLAQLRTAYWLGDSAVHLHALASLIAQAEQLPAPGHPRRPRPGTHLGPDRRAPGHHRRHRGTPPPEQAMINLTRITGIMPMSGRRILLWLLARRYWFGSAGLLLRVKQVSSLVQQCDEVVEFAESLGDTFGEPLTANLEVQSRRNGGGDLRPKIVDLVEDFDQVGRGQPTHRPSSAHQGVRLGSDVSRSQLWLPGLLPRVRPY